MENRESRESKESKESRENAVEMQNLCKAFNDRDYILKGIDLKIPRKSIMVIIGFSGTGKSVLLKHILGLFKPTSGDIRVLGEKINELTYEELVRLRCRFGVLFQGSALFDDMSVLENVCFPLKEHAPHLSSSEREDRAAHRLKDVGMDPKHFQKLPSEVSGGMQKRVGLARALTLNPEMLIYDEPTTGLDPILTEMVDDLILKQHHQNEDLTSIVVSHDLSAAFRLGEFITMLDNGKVLLSGTPQDFFESKIDLVQRFIHKGFKRKLE